MPPEPLPIVVASRHRFVVVEAAAGTGKTYFLERKFIDLIVHDGARVDQIVVVTFTEKATAELRGRIRNLLADLLAQVAPTSEAGERLHAAYRDFDRAAISTIHGFCQRVLRKHQPGFVSADNTNADIRQIVAHAFPVVLRRLLRDDEALAEWVCQHDADDLRSLVGRACAAALEGRKQAITASGGLDKVVATLVPPMLEEIAAVKVRGRWFDFQDLLRGAADLVGADDGVVAAAIRGDTPWALIDEFQDTDALQWRILSAIWMHPEARGLTVVGDPKQAIYGFRGANLAVYQQACHALGQAGGVTLPLGDNYRSSQAAVAAYNQLFASGFFSHLDYAPVTAKADPTMGLYAQGRALAPLVLWNTDDWDVRKAQALGAVVREIFWLCGRGDAVAASRADAAPTLREASGERALRYSDIMILAPNNRILAETAAQLRAAGIPVSIRGRQSVFSTPEAAALSTLLTAIAAPRDHSAMLRALRTMFFPPGDLYLVDERDPCVDWLVRWNALARRRRFADMFSDILATSKVTERLIIGEGGTRAVANVRQLLEACLEFVASGPVSIAELAAHVARLCDDDEDGETAHGLRIDLDGEAVRLMTCHTAKGLEAPVVMLLSFQRAAKPARGIVPFERDAQLWFTLARKDAGDGEGKALAALSAKQESERLAYVALTRAKVRTYVLGPMRLKTGGLVNDHFYMPIWRSLEAAKLGDAQCEVVALPPPAEAAAAAPTEVAIDAVLAEPPPMVEAVPTRSWQNHARGIKVVSYSSLKWRDDLVSASAEAGEAARHFGDEVVEEAMSANSSLPPDAMPAGRETGLFLHRLLELAPLPGRDEAFEAWADAAATQAGLAAASAEFGLASAHHAQALRLAFNALMQPLALGRAPTPLARADKLARELAFMTPLQPAAARSDMMVGVLDVLCEVDGRLWVIDYKSDVAAGADLRAAGAYVATNYGWQKMIYTLAMLRLARVSDEATFAQRFGGVGFLFLRSGLFVVETPSWRDVSQWQARLAQQLEAAW